ncbi:uncharacterized protein LOC108107542 [Drosophila eugracilis]|uniref:uncharacterized protein LOC108107542 n=1 Tax=Drosophila eugracilis TaxID=29029 RepID=UPI0007E72983|nr:uncharacterized protein LOC108107542 [Drosophila eugracilis]
MEEYTDLIGKIGILNLNSYCFNEIFRQIKSNCDLECSKDDLLRYNDLISFVISSEEVTKAFRDWSPDLYNKLCLENTFLNRSPWIVIDFSNIYQHMNGLSVNERKLFWSNYLNQITENENLKSVKLVYEPAEHYREHMDRFEELTNCLKNKYKLRELFLKMKGYTLESVPQIRHLETLYLDVGMRTNILVQFCQLNPNLRKLILSNNELYGRLTDIVPYCNQLEHLSFLMKHEVDATEYAALAKLPRLNELILLGQHQEGSLLRLFQGFRDKHIHRICIPETYVSNEEALALTSITCLVSLKCCLRDNSIYADLPLTGNLIDVRILGHPKQYDLYDPISNDEQKDLFKVTYRGNTDLNKISDGYYQSMLLKDPKLMYKAMDQDFAQAARLCCEGWYSTSCLLALMQIQSQSQLRLIERIDLYKKDPISEEEILTLASIATLTDIRCSILQIKQMIAVKLKQLEGMTETENRVDRIRTECLEIRLVHDHGFLTLILDFFGKYNFYNAKIFAPFAKLRNLKRLEIRGNHITGSFVPFFKEFTLLETQNLRELEAVIISPAELKELVKIQSLRILKSGFFCSRNFDHVAELNQLESLTLIVHPQGSLTRLLKDLSSRKVQVLKSLSIEGTRLSTEEIDELAGIRSLERLRLGLPEAKYWELKSGTKTSNLKVPYCQKCRLRGNASNFVKHKTDFHTLNAVPDGEALDAQYSFLTELNSPLTPINFDLLAKLPKLNELLIYLDYKPQAVENLLTTIALQSPQKLQKLAFTSQDFRLITAFKNLQSLECVVYHTKDINFIADIKNLTELQIHNPLRISLWAVLKELKALPNLQSLLLDNTDLDFLDMVEVTKITWLKRIRLGLADKIFIFFLIQLKDLEVMEITSTHFAAKNESNFVYSFLVTCKNIRSMSLYRYYDFFSKDYVNGILNTIKLFRDPAEHPPFKLCGIWSDFNSLKQLDMYNEDFLVLERCDSIYESNQESEEDLKFSRVYSLNDSLE